MDQACVRCGSGDFLEPTRIIREFDKDGKHFFEYNLKCNKCGRQDPYISDNGELIDPVTSFRNEITGFGERLQPTVGSKNAQSDMAGAMEWLAKNGKADLSPLDADFEQRKAAGLL